MVVDKSGPDWNSPKQWTLSRKSTTTEHRLTEQHVVGLLHAGLPHALEEPQRRRCQNRLVLFVHGPDLE